MVIICKWYCCKCFCSKWFFFISFITIEVHSAGDKQHYSQQMEKKFALACIQIPISFYLKCWWMLKALSYIISLMLPLWSFFQIPITSRKVFDFHSLFHIFKSIRSFWKNSKLRHHSRCKGLFSKNIFFYFDIKNSLKDLDWMGNC